MGTIEDEYEVLFTMKPLPRSCYDIARALLEDPGYQQRYIWSDCIMLIGNRLPEKNVCIRYTLRIYADIVQCSFYHYAEGILIEKYEKTCQISGDDLNDCVGSIVSMLPKMIKL